MPFSVYQAGQSLEAGEAGLPMPERLLAASQRVLDTEATAGGKGGFLRPYQLPAHDNFGHYLMDLATSPEYDSVSPFCRIVLPPRTGKTVIAASIIQLTGLCSVFVVPTKTLVTQTAREFASLLPGIPVGFYYGETQALVPNGINISTYAMLQRHFDGGGLPEWIRMAGPVFLDEAHHVMTPYRNTEARIIVILPECMQRPPILPIDLMLQPGETYTCGDLISPDSEISASPRRAIDNLGGTPIRSVQTKSQVVARVAFIKPGLDPGNAQQIRRVLLSCPSFSLKKASGVRRFQRFLFKHPLFTGTGDALLRYLSVAPTKPDFSALLLRVFPEISGTYFLANSRSLDENWHSCRRDFDYIRTKAMAPNDNHGRPVEPLADALHMLCGGAREMASPEDCLLIREKIDKLLELMSELDERAQWVLKYRLGLYGEPELTWEQIGILFDITRERVRQIYLRNVKILSLKYRRRTGDWHPSAKVYSEPADLICLIS